MNFQDLNILPESSTSQVPAWKPFNRLPNARAVADGLQSIPGTWSLTPLHDKKPTRKDWQIEAFIPHLEIARLIMQGDRRTSKKGNEYTNYFSGFGIRTGDPSDGITTIDVDGETAEPLLIAISGGDLPITPKWTSGKTGRYQIAFQIPNKLRALLKDFNRAIITEWEGLQTAQDVEGKPLELLEFRYNGVQSALPPSRHPTTGSYKWINSPDTTPVAIAPQWLCDLLLKLVNDKRTKEQERKERAVRWAEIQSQAKYQGGTVTNLVDFLEFEILPKLSPEQIFNWQGHNFRDYGTTLKGCPPWRASSSGTSFHVWWDGSRWAWQDKASGEGGGAVQYRWQLRGRQGRPKGKDFVDIVSELARDAGVILPELSRIDYLSSQEPDTKLYDDYVKREKEELDPRIGEAQDFRRLVNLSFKKVKRFLRKTFKGFATPPVTLPIPPKTLHITPGQIPDWETYQLLEQPKLIFQGSDRLAIWAECIAKGWHDILDTSGTGSGKSHTAGLASPSDLGAEQLWYLANDHRNPTTSAIESEYTDLAVRNNGFKTDPTRQTPLGKDFLQWAKPGETPDVKGNCDRAHLFRALADKNIEVQESNSSPICETCIHFGMISVDDGTGTGKQTWRPKCSTKLGDGYGFRADYSAALSAKKLRAHPNSCPEPRRNFEVDKDGKNVDPGFDYRNSVIFWDEAGTAINTQKVLTVTKPDLDAVRVKIAAIADDILPDHQKRSLEPLFQTLEGLLNPAYSGYMPFSGRFDLNNAEIRGLLPEMPQSLKEIIPILLDELAPDLSFLSNKTKVETEYTRSKAQKKATEKADKEAARIAPRQRTLFKIESFGSTEATLTTSQLRAKAKQEYKKKQEETKSKQKHKRDLRAARIEAGRINTKIKASGLDAIALNWFVDFLYAWMWENNYYLKREIGSELKIYSRDFRNTNVAQAAKSNIFLDATLSPERLASMIHSDKIIHIQQESPSYENLTVTQVTGVGRLGNNRRESADARVSAILTELSRRHPDLKVIDWKAKLTSDNQGCHFRDGRGINRFADASALVIIGIPCPNLGGLAIKYTLLKGKPADENSPDFRAFVDEDIRAELVQEAGRLRANLRPNEELNLYIVNDYDLSFLKAELPSAKFEQVEAFRVSPDAGDRYQRTKYAIFQVFSRLLESGAKAEKITQEAIASQLETSRSRISQIASEFGGWSKLRKVLILLYKNLYSKSNNSENLTPLGQEPDSTLSWLAHEYLPLLAANPDDSPPEEVIKAVVRVIEAEGLDRFTEMLKITDTIAKMSIISYLISLFPEELMPEEVWL